MRTADSVVLAILALAACGDSTGTTDELFRPTQPALLSSGSPTKDEDPSVIRARDGKLFVAWFSDRGNNPDIYITNTSNGFAWSSPVRITTDAGGDFNPSLHQDAQGVFHLAWFRWIAPFRGSIWYNSSPDGVTWNPANEVRVTTTAAVDDWVPTLTQTADGTLLIVFVSEARDPTNPTSELFIARKATGSTSWSAPTPLSALNSATEHDHLPFAARTGSGVTLTWVRHDTTQALPWLNPKSVLYTSTSADGVTWTTPVRITNESGNVVNLFPALYTSLSGDWWFLWLSTRTGTARVFELPLGNAATYPSGLLQRDLPIGYSHKIAPTSSPGVYLAVWVQGPDGAQDIYYRFFRK